MHGYARVWHSSLYVSSFSTGEVSLVALPTHEVNEALPTHEVTHEVTYNHSHHPAGDESDYRGEDS